MTRFTVDVSKAVDNLDKKHAIYLVARGGEGKPACILKGLGFSKKGETMEFPESPSVAISVNNQPLELPATPVRMTAKNGYTGYDNYEAFYNVAQNDNAIPVVTASSNNPDVKIEITQPKSSKDSATVRFDYNGVVKTYEVKPRI